LQALGASASAVITAAIARDLWSGKVLADRLSLLFLVVGFAPIVAPSLGSVILLLLNWHGLFWFLVVFGLVVALSVTALPETSSPLERKQTRLRDAAGSYLLLVRNTPFILYVLTGACLVGVLFTHITGSSFLYINTLNVTPGQFAALFSFTALGFIGATQFNRLLLKRMSLFSIVRAAVIAAVICSLLLLLVVLSGFATIVSLTLLLFALSAALGCAFPNVAALAFSTVQERLGSASALQGTMQSVFGGIAGGLVSALGNAATLPLMGIMAGFAILAAVFLMAAHRNVALDQRNSAKETT
jgi:MFS transporter, DHA1 family, multidrug resistance protein